MKIINKILARHEKFFGHTSFEFQTRNYITLEVKRIRNCIAIQNLYDH